MTENKNSYMRWYILALAMLTCFFITGVGRICILVLSREIATDIDLNLVAIGTIWGMDSLAGLFICIPSGMLLDRFGIKRIAAIFCVLAGLFAVLRGLSGSFIALAATTLCYGMAAAIVLALGPKILSYYFMGRHLGLMNALFFVPIQVGQMAGTLFSATWLSPLLGGWRNVFFAYAVPPVIIGMLWLTTKNLPHGGSFLPLQRQQLSFKQVFSQLIRIRYLWILGIVFGAIAGSHLSLIGYLPLYLRNIGWSPADADGTLTLMLASACAGMLPLMFLSDRLRSRRLFVFFIILGVSVALIPLYVTRDATVIILTIIVNGVLRGSTSTLLTTLLLETPGIEPEYMGTAVGIMNTISMVGGFIMPPLGNSFAAVNPALPFIFWAVVPTVVAFLLLLIKPGPDREKLQGN